jgi:hypothetical protein
LPLSCGEAALVREAYVSEFKIRYFNENDGCTYCWDECGLKWVKVCPVDTLPENIKQRILRDRQNARILLQAEV